MGAAPAPGRAGFQLWYLIPIIGGVLALTAVLGGMLGNAIRSSMPPYSPVMMASEMSSLKTSYAAQGITIVWPYRGSNNCVEEVIPAQYSDEQMRAAMFKLTHEFQRVRKASGADPGGQLYLMDDAGRPRGDMSDPN